ncbi:MAG: serine hydrolase domain-containing protein [Telluria sp.]
MQIASTCLSAMLSCAMLAAVPAAATPMAVNDKLLDALQQMNGVPGMSAAIIKDGKLVWQGSTGYADVDRKVPVSRTTRFRLASVSKFVTAVMLARLVEQDRIRLSDPVSAYLPDFPAKAYTFSSLQLASHSAGMPHYDALQDAQRDEAATPFKNVAAGLEVFKDRPLVHPPGTKFLYSSFGFNLLAAVMERAAKTDFRSQLATLSDIAKAPSLQAEQLNTGRKHWSALYDVGGTELPRGNISYNWAGGGLLSNASDLARVGAATLDPSYISPATLSLFTTPVRFTDGSEVTGENFTMGIGLRLNVDQHGRRYYHHSGATRGARSHISVYPDQRLVVAILSNASWASAIEMTARALAEPVMANGDNKQCVARRFAYQGTYKEKPVTGAVQFMPMHGYCTAVFGADNALGKWLSGGASGTSFTLLGQGAKLSMVTPLGLFPVSKSGTSMTLTISGKPLALTLSEG